MVSLINLIISIILLRGSVGSLDNCWKSDRESCKIDGAFQSSHSNYSIEVTIDCNSDRDVPKRHNKRFIKITNFTLNGCQSDKTVNPFEEIIDPKSVQFFTIEMFYIQNLNSSFVEKVANLKKLELKDNEILSISEDIFTVFLNLEELSFVDNISPSFNFTSLQTLQNLKKLTIIQPTWTIQLDHLLRIPSIRSLQLSVDAFNSGLITSEADNNVDSLEEIVITNTLLNLQFHQSGSIGILRNVRTMILKNNRITMFPFADFDLPNLETLDLSGNLLESVNLNNFTIKSPKLQTFNVSNNEIANFTMDMKDENLKSLKIIDISHNNLQNIQILNHENNVSSTNCQIIVNSNPWSCLFLVSREYLEIFKAFKYESDFSHMNVNGLNCSYILSKPLDLDYTIEPWVTTSTTEEPVQIKNPIETSTLESIKGTDATSMNNEENTVSTTEVVATIITGYFEIYQLILWITALLVIITLCAFTFCFIRQKRCKSKEPFYGLIRQDSTVTNNETVSDIFNRKLPSNGYETPLTYTTPKYTVKPNDIIYEEIPDYPYEQVYNSKCPDYLL